MKGLDKMTDNEIAVLAHRATKGFPAIRNLVPISEVNGFAKAIITAMNDAMPSTPTDRYISSLHGAVERLTAALHVATLRAHPTMTHAEIQAEIARIGAGRAPE